MMQYDFELEGQQDFFNKILLRVDNTLTIEDIQKDNTDGVLNGNILEFKLNINDLNSVLFQSVKYLSRMRLKGKSIPENIVLISLNNKKVYIFKSFDYISDIEKIYVGSASKNNEGFSIKKEYDELSYLDHSDAEDLIQTLKTDNYTKINIDENCVVGWAKRFYKENPSAKKSDFIGDTTGEVKIVGEIRNPKHFNDFINVYQGVSNVQFQYLMDKLNDELSQKDLGAFYTPKEYSKKAAELVREAIERVPEGNDYIILDRCAGTGNLEKFLTDEEISHCIVSTYEYYEYKVLMELLGSKVRHIVPPFEEGAYDAGKVFGADALSKDYLDNKIIKKYIEDDKCTIIMLENPPYAEVNGLSRGTGQTAEWKKNHIVKEMKKEIKGVPSNDLANIFIWSAFKYYLRQPTDSYIVFSPIKYWKAQNLISKKPINGYLFNRKHFHTKTNAAISCILWSNEEADNDKIKLQALDINSEGQLVDEGFVETQKVYRTILEMVAPIVEPFSKKDTLDGIVCELNGTEMSDGNKKSCVKEIYNENLIGYLVANAFTFDNARLKSSLTIAGRYDGHGFHLRKECLLEMLPMLAAGKYTDNQNNWKIMSFVMKSGDGMEQYIKDSKKGLLLQWQLKVLLWSCLTNQTKMRSLNGSDGRFYKNETSLDSTNGNTLALEHLKSLNKTEKEIKLLAEWDFIISKAKLTKNYNDKLTYGIYQIQEELNTKYKDAKDKTQYDYPELNGALNALKKNLKDYYNEEIVPNLFKYVFLK